MALTRWVCLLRGINVGGAGRLPMAGLRELLEGLGAASPRTLIQSGNAVFDHTETDAEALAERIGEAVEAGHGFRPVVIAMTAEDFADLVAALPFADEIEDGKTVHAFLFSRSPVAPDFDRLTALAAPSERWEITGTALVLHAPDGIGRSKLAAGAEKALGVPVTARNLNTLRKLAELAAG